MVILTVSDAPINPIIVPDIMMALVSEDQQEKDKEEQRLNEQIAKYPDVNSKEFRYLNNIIHVIYGAVARVNKFRKEFTKKVENHDSINEDAVILLGTVITAITTSPWGIPAMAASSGGAMAGIKLVFKWEKGYYKDKMRGELNNQINILITETTNRVMEIYNDIYQPHQPMTMSDGMQKTLGSLAISFSTSVIPPATFFSFKTPSKT